MDTVKIGKFLMDLRKEKSLTQEQLGEQIGVTNKTVSRWENGNYLPPIEMIQILSELYGVTINEILCGERLNEQTYKATAENNIKLIFDESERKIKTHNKIMNWTIAIVVAAIYIFCSLITQKWQYTWIIWLIYCVYRITAEYIVKHIRKIYQSKRH